MHSVVVLHTDPTDPPDPPGPRPTVALLYSTDRHTRRLKTYQLNMPGRCFFQNDRSTFDINLQPTDHTLIAVPAPFGGVIVIGEKMLSYYDLKGSSKTISINSVIITALVVDGRFLASDTSRSHLRISFRHTFIGDDPALCLLGDSQGGLHLLRLYVQENKSVNNLSLECIGKVN